MAVNRPDAIRELAQIAHRAPRTTVPWRLFEAVWGRADLTSPQVETIKVIMKVASVSELKARLSAYLQEVKRGGEVQILDRGKPVARLVGLQPGPTRDADRRELLARAGILKLGTGNAAAVLATPPLSLHADLSGALADDRDEGF